MLHCLSLNPALDKSASLPRFSFDSPNRLELQRLELGGKGVNVAKMLRTLGAEVCLSGFDYAGKPVEKALAGSGVSLHLLPLNGELRVNLKIKETETGRTLEINERGCAVNEEELTGLGKALFDLCRPGDFISLSGSLPPGAPRNTYAGLCGALKKKGCFVAVDCDGDVLWHALSAAPDLIKPNAQEFEALTGVSAQSLPEAIAACKKLLQKGVGAVCLSRGAEGALYCGKEGVFSCPAAPVAVKGVQGAGDSLLAGMLFALSQNIHPGEALRFASAVAGASVMQPGTVLGKKEDVEKILSRMPESLRCF